MINSTDTENDICGFKQHDHFTIRMKHEGINFDYDETKNNFLTKIKSFNEGSNFSDYKLIPMVEHVVYLFAEDGPVYEFEEYITERVIRTAKRLDNISESSQNVNSPKFSHIVWTNYPSRIPENIKIQGGFEVKNIKDLESQSLIYNNAIEMINDCKNTPYTSAILTQASDIIRVLAIKSYGGIYHDMDYEIYDAGYINNLTKKFDLILGFEHNFKGTDIGNAFFAASAGHDFITQLTLHIYRNLNFKEHSPLYVQRPYNLFTKVLCETGPCAMTGAYYKYLSLINNAAVEDLSIVFPNNALYDYNYARDVLPTTLKCLRTEDKAVRNFEGVEIPLIGADLFCGSWTKDAKFLDAIYYSNCTFYNMSKINCNYSYIFNYTAWNFPVNITLVITESKIKQRINSEFINTQAITVPSAPTQAEVNEINTLNIESNSELDLLHKKISEFQSKIDDFFLAKEMYEKDFQKLNEELKLIMQLDLNQMKSKLAVFDDAIDYAREDYLQEHGGLYIPVIEVVPEWVKQKEEWESQTNKFHYQYDYMM
jgi:hypothetical protein